MSFIAQRIAKYQSCQTVIDTIELCYDYCINFTLEVVLWTHIFLLRYPLVSLYHAVGNPFWTISLFNWHHVQLMSFGMVRVR